MIVRIIRSIMSNPDAIFFDFGETLATLAPSKEELFIQAARSIGLKLEPAAVCRAYQIVDFNNKYSSVTVKDRAAFYHNYNRKLAEALGISSHFAELGPALTEQFRKEKKWILFDDSDRVVSQLEKLGHQLALVANWNSDLPTLSEELGIGAYFSTIVASETVGVEKPDPAIFQLTADRLSLSPQEQKILYVGNDYSLDVMGARAAGLTPVLIDRYALYPHADCLRFASLDEWLEAMTQD